MPRPPRQIINAARDSFQPYDLDGPLQEDIAWLPLSYDMQSGNGTYLMRMQAGAVTVPHDHEGTEDFMILEGDLVESDGTRLEPGDCVSYAPGTRHNSHSETGCLILVCEWGKDV